MLQRKGLGALKLSLGDSLTNFEDSMKDMGSTYRIEGLSLNEEHFRMCGEELKMAVTYSDLIIGKRIGQGACSAVHLAEHEKTGEMYAVKMFNVFDKGQRSQMTKEIKVLTELDCEAIISYRGAWYSEGRIGIILEYMDRGSLEFLADEHVKLDEQTIAAIVFQILWGLGYLHYDNRLHRDIKPANVLINSEGHVKVSDFGISTALENTLSSGSNVGSYRYMSPERLLGERYDASSDLWSVGIVVVQLWTKIYPFHYACTTAIDLLSELNSLDIGEFLKELKLPEIMHSFVISMLAFVPEERLNTDDLLTHAWFESNGIIGLEEAHSVVRAWIVDQEGPRPAPDSITRANKVTNTSSGKIDRGNVRKHRSSLDLLLSDDRDSDHPLLATPSLSRANSTSNGNSNANSVKTELSDSSFRNNSRNSSSNNLYARGAGISNGASPDQFDSSYDRLKSMLPAVKPTFTRSSSEGAGLSRGRVDSIDEVEEEPGIAVGTGEPLAVFANDVAANNLTGSIESRIGGNKRERYAALGSTDGSTTTLNTTSKTQTTGTVYSDLNLSMVGEETYAHEEFYDSDNSLDDIADEVVGEMDDCASVDDEAMPRRPRLRRPPSEDMDAKESYYRSHK